MILVFKRFVTFILCISFLGSTVLGWGQDLRLNRKLERAVADQMTTDQQQVRQMLLNTFEYPDIIQAVYKLHDFYNNPPLPKTSRDFQLLVVDNLPIQTELRDTVMPQQHPLTFKANELLKAISENKLTSEDLLNYIDPVNPSLDPLDAWRDTLYATLYLNNTLGNTPSSYEGLEHFLRHAQMRVSYRLSTASPLAQRDHLQTQAIAQLRLSLLVLHTTYQRLYGKDPLKDIKGPFPFPHQLKEVVITPKGPSSDSMPSQTIEFSTDSTKTVYDVVRKNFFDDIRGLKTLLPNQDRYSFTTFVEALKGNKQTQQFSSQQALADSAMDFFWITPIIELGKFIFTEQDTTPMANLSAIVPAAVQYELLQDNFANVKQIIRLLEPQKLAENQYGAVFKNDKLYQDAQPAIAEIFNTLYTYAATPGYPATSRQIILNMLVDFANPNEYSIMTRLGAISVAAKLSQEATTDPSWNPVKHHANQMAQYIVDIYSTLTANGTLSGLQDYGLNADQMQLLANELARLYNIFAVQTQGKYPLILPAGQENVETVWGYNDSGFPVKKLHYFGARVKTSWGQEVELFSYVNTNPAKYKKDSQDMMVDLAVAVCSWKALAAVYRVGKLGVSAVMRFTLPRATTTQLMPLMDNTLGANSHNVLTLESIMRPGVNIDNVALQRLKYILNNPIPEITSRAELTQFLKLSETASDKVIQQSLRQLAKKYHPDRLLAFTSEKGSKFVTDQMSSLNELQEIMKGKAVFKVNRPTAINSAAGQATNYHVPDPNSWGRTAAGFAIWDGVDRTISLANVPLEEKMAKDAQKEAKKQTPSTEDMPEATAEKMPTDFLNELSTREVKEGDGSSYRLPYIDRSGSFFRLPVNLGRLIYHKGNIPLEKEDLAQLEIAHLSALYTKAEKQGTIVGFKQFITQNIEDLATNKADDFKYYAGYLTAIKTGKKEIKTAYQIYRQDLKHALTLADQNLTEADKWVIQSRQKFINTRTDILVRGVRAFYAQQLPSLLANQAKQLQWEYPHVKTEQDIAQLAELFTQEVRTEQEKIIGLFNAVAQGFATGQNIETLQTEVQQRFAQKETKLQAKIDQIHARLQTAQEAVNIKNLWGNTMSDLQEQLDQDMKRMYPSGIENYPQVKEQIDALFGTYIQEVNDLLETAQQNEEKQLMSNEENFQTFIKGVIRSLDKRNAAFTTIEKELSEQGIKLFIPQEPEQTQDSLMDETIY